MVSARIVMLCAVLALGAKLAVADVQYTDSDCPADYIGKYFTSWCDVDYGFLKHRLDDAYYRYCFNLPPGLRVGQLRCIHKNRCFDYDKKSCCSDDGHEFFHPCFAHCFGYGDDKLSVGNCGNGLGKK